MSHFQYQYSEFMFIYKAKNKLETKSGSLQCNIYMAGPGPIYDHGVCCTDLNCYHGQINDIHA